MAHAPNRGAREKRDVRINKKQREKMDGSERLRKFCLVMVRVRVGDYCHSILVKVTLYFKHEHDRILLQ